MKAIATIKSIGVGTKLALSITKNKADKLKIKTNSKKLIKILKKVK
ncbi:MAG: hypothetical protein V3W20_12575 [Candidatus Neomarinimicrobiota bacterium]